eukprot:COSAG05_NODE_421_length_9965_cov_60.769207_12_plen_90_part_00
MQLVLLDHGLYRDVPDTVRLNYCRLWKGIVLGDAAEVQRASDALGVVSPHMEGIRSGKNPLNLTATCMSYPYSENLCLLRLAAHLYLYL